MSFNRFYQSNFRSIALALIAFILCAASPKVWATESDTAQDAEAEAPKDAVTSAESELKKAPKGAADLKEKYNLTDEQIAALKARHMSIEQIRKSAELSKLSGKSLDEIVKMRLDDKMGWGRIAKELGLHPGVLGKGHDNEKRDEHRSEKKESRAEHREERKESHKNSKE